MAVTLHLPRPPDLDSSSSTDSSSFNRSVNRSVRVAELARRKTEAKDTLVAALKYFAEGRAVLGYPELHFLYFTVDIQHRLERATPTALLIYSICY